MTSTFPGRLCPCRSCEALCCVCAQDPALDSRLSAAAKVCNGNGFVECREDAPFTDDGGDAVAVHVGPQVVVDAAKDHADLLALELLEEFEQRLGSGVVDVGDGGGIDDDARG